MLAFTFPGQGSQRPGMGQPWVGHESWELVTEASDISGRDVGRLLLDADAEELKDTRNAQLTTFVSSLMVLDAVERLGIEPSLCAGHSLGEYTALAATGALGFDEGIRLVVARADAMHDAGIESPGTMAAVLGLDDDEVETACRLAMFGSPTSTHLDKLLLQVQLMVLQRPASKQNLLAQSALWLSRFRERSIRHI
jgi:[acyl-carrier-protein] S-malonyltransferase